MSGKIWWVGIATLFVVALGMSGPSGVGPSPAGAVLDPCLCNSQCDCNKCTHVKGYLIQDETGARRFLVDRVEFIEPQMAAMPEFADYAELRGLLFDVANSKDLDDIKLGVLISADSHFVDGEGVEVYYTNGAKLKIVLHWDESIPRPGVGVQRNK